eukprot:scaffold648038_cov44-Prasinocladus_malaysianus.AAC.1
MGSDNKSRQQSDQSATSLANAIALMVESLQRKLGFRRKTDITFGTALSTIWSGFTNTQGHQTWRLRGCLDNK